MPEQENHVLSERLVPPTLTHASFSDIVQGEDLEFRNSLEPTPFKINTPHIEPPSSLSHFSPPSILSRCSASQLTTMAGAASGFLAGVVVCPLDVCKTRLQAQGAAGHMNKYRGFLHTIKTILREEGVRGLYRGLVPITIGYLPTWTIYFTVYEQGKKRYPQLLSKQGLESDALTHFCSALTAGMVSTISVNPIWVVKTRLMIQTGNNSSIYDGRGSALGKQTYYRGTFDAFRQMYKEEGIRVFYSGLVPSMFGLLHVGIHFPVYEKLKIILQCNNLSEQERQVSGILWRLITASAVSKMIASSITYPHEILRTRMQLKKSNRESHVLLKAISEIYRCEGLKGFYAGYGTNLARTVPASAVTLVSFEYFKTYLLALGGKQGKFD